MKSSIKRRTRVAAVLAAGTMLLAGCGNGSSSSDDNSSSGDLSLAEIYKTGLVNVKAPSGDPKDGGTLTVADFGEPRVLDPAVTYANGATGGSAMAAIYDTLVRYDYTKGSWEPQLAESLTSDDNITWTLKLRDGVKFTDGTPLNADAVLASQKYYASKYAYQSLLMMANVAETKKVDDTTITYKLRSPWTTFPNMLAQGPGMIMAPAAYKDPAAFKPIGAGPFMFDQYKPGEELTLKANPDYFNGKPHLDGLKFVWLGAVEDKPKLEALTSGNADTAFLRAGNIVEQARKDGLPGMMFGTGMAANFWINVREGHPGADVRVRQAINLAFDVDSFNERAREGGISTKGFFASSSPWYTDVTPPKTNQEEAKKLLKDAMGDGYNGEITYSHGADPTSQKQAVTLKAMLEAVGFKVKLDPLRSVADQVQKIYREHTYDMAIAATTLSDIDPYTRLAGVLGSQSPSNAAGYANPEMDKLLSQLQAADSPETGKSIMAQIEKLWFDEVPGIGIAAGGTFQAWNKDVHGIAPTTEEMVLYDQAWKE